MKQKSSGVEMDALLSTGIEGLDDILGGGLAANRLYLLEGNPGSGKTTLALQYLRAGVEAGETVLFVALSESISELHASAASHGWTLDGIHLFELPVSEGSLPTETRYTMFRPSEVELAEVTKAVLAEAERIRPTRLVFDSLSELRLLADDPLRYRRQILALKQYFARQGCTVLLVDDRTGEQRDMHLHSLAHGVLSMERMESDYGGLRRRIQVSKMRACAFREGYHDFVIRHGGVAIFPRLIASEHHVDYPREPTESGIAAIDTLLGGGLARGTSTLVLGPSGCGKTSLATQFATHAARHGKHATMFLFEEGLATFKERSKGLGMDVQRFVKGGSLSLRQVDPAELSPGEFSRTVRDEVEKNGAEIVIIDSLNGYLNAMPNERFLMLHLHELLTYLGQHGVTTILLMTQHGISGDMQVPVDASYLADTVILLRYFEAVGEVRQAISVIKKRTGRHERTIRELRFDGGLHVGEPVREFQGVLSGNPQVVNGAGARRKAPA
jgi:circadian clock protein KaiC